MTPSPKRLVFGHFSTVRKFRNMRKKIAKKSNWFSRESICLCLGLLFLSPPGAAPLRQSRCSMKAKSSSSSSTHFQPDRYALKHKKASSPWKAGPVGKEENMWFHLLTVQWKNPKNIIGVAKITTNVQFCHKITTYSHMSQKNHNIHALLLRNSQHALRRWGERTAAGATMMPEKHEEIVTISVWQNVRNVSKA